MALVRCEECQQTVSDKAASCPHCGAPQGFQAHPPALPPLLQADTRKTKTPSKNRAGCLVAGLVLFILFLVAINSENKDAPKQQAANISEADRAKKEALEAAKKQEEEARCNVDLQ